MNDLNNQHAKIKEIFQNIPLVIYKLYFNYHHERAFYFSGDLKLFNSLRGDITKKLLVKETTQQISTDTYLKFEENEISEEILNMRIRKFSEGSQNGRTNLIALFKSEPGNENVLVVTFDLACTNEVEDTIVNYLNQSIPLKKSFSVTKKSTTLVLNEPQLKEDELTGIYLNISFDEILNVQVEGKDVAPTDIFGYDKIIEVEWNSDTPPEVLKQAFNTLQSHPLFFSRTTPKTHKKSIIISRWNEKQLTK